jgi:hypothetical protein
MVSQAVPTQQRPRLLRIWGEDVACDRKAGHAHGNRIEARGGELGDREGASLGSTRARPERLREPFGGAIEARKRPCRPDVGHVGNQGVERRAALDVLAKGARANERLTRQ